MSFKSTLNKTVTELYNISYNFEKYPTKYLLSLFKRSRKHLKTCGLDVTTLISEHTQYEADCYELNDTFKHNFSDFELQVIYLSHCNSELKKILDKKENLK